MARRARDRMAGLAGNLTLLALAIVGGAVVLVGAAALGGVYDFARSEVDARLVDYSRLVASEVEGRFSAAGAAVRDAADTVVRGDGRADSAALALAYGRNRQRFERMFVVDERGVLEASQPALEGPAATVDLPDVADATDTPRFASLSHGEAAPPTVWVYVSTVTTGHVLLGKLKTDAVAVLLDQVAGARQGRAAVVMEVDGPLLLQGADRAFAPTASSSSPSTRRSPRQAGSPSGTPATGRRRAPTATCWAWPVWSGGLRSPSPTRWSCGTCGGRCCRRPS